MLRNKSLQFWLRLAIVLAIIIFCLYEIDLAGPFVLSLIVTLLLWPLVNKIEYYGKVTLKLKWFPRWLAIIPAFILFCTVIVLIFNYIFIPFVGEFTKLLNNIPWLLQRLMEIMTFVQIKYLNKDMPPQLLSLVNNTVFRVGNYSVDLAQRGIATIVHMASIVLELLIVPILTFYMLKDGRQFVESVTGIFNDKNSNYARKMLASAYIVLGGYVRAEILLAVNMFVIVLCAMTAFGIPYPLVLALLAGIAEWIPIVGPIIASIPAVALAALISLKLALKVAIFYGIMQLIDGQIIKPKVFGTFFHMHPIVIISVVFIAGSLFGVIGMMLAVPCTALAQIIAKELWYFNKTYKGENE